MIDLNLDNYDETMTTDIQNTRDLGNLNVIPNIDRQVIYDIKPNMEKGPWIAGGACLKWLQRKPLGRSDIDVYCANQSQFDRLSKYFRRFDKHPYMTKYAHSFTYNSYQVQIIKNKFYHSARHIIDSFDITICQIVTDGDRWLLGLQTMRDINSRTLRFRMPLRANAPKRLVKYWTYGYRPTPDTIKLINESLVIDWDFQEDYSDGVS